MCASTPTPTTWLNEARVWSRAALVAVALTLLAGCSSVPIPPTYTQDELKAICERHGGWWHPDELMGGFCEYQQGGFP
jgi:hypothetical protein